MLKVYAHIGKPADGLEKSAFWPKAVTQRPMTDDCFRLVSAIRIARYGDGHRSIAAIAFVDFGAIKLPLNARARRAVQRPKI